jgi:hypothetical protein
MTPKLYAVWLRLRNVFWANQANIEPVACDISCNLFGRHTLPNSLALAYEKCKAPPPLHLFDQYSDKPCAKLYSFPEFFMNEWKQDQLDRKKKTKETKDAKEPELVQVNTKERTRIDMHQSQKPAEDKLVLNVARFTAPPPPPPPAPAIARQDSAPKPPQASQSPSSDPKPSAPDRNTFLTDIKSNQVLLI